MLDGVYLRVLYEKGPTAFKKFENYRARRDLKGPFHSNELLLAFSLTPALPFTIAHIRSCSLTLASAWCMSLIHSSISMHTVEVPREGREVEALGCPFVPGYAGSLASVFHTPSFRLPSTQRGFWGLSGAQMVLGVESHRVGFPPTAREPSENLGEVQKVEC